MFRKLYSTETSSPRLKRLSFLAINNTLPLKIRALLNPTFLKDLRIGLMSLNERDRANRLSQVHFKPKSAHISTRGTHMNKVSRIAELLVELLNPVIAEFKEKDYLHFREINKTSENIYPLGSFSKKCINELFADKEYYPYKNPFIQNMLLCFDDEHQVYCFRDNAFKTNYFKYLPSDIKQYFRTIYQSRLLNADITCTMAEVHDIGYTAGGHPVKLDWPLVISHNYRAVRIIKHTAHHGRGVLHVPIEILDGIATHSNKEKYDTVLKINPYKTIYPNSGYAIYNGCSEKEISQRYFIEYQKEKSSYEGLPLLHESNILMKADIMEYLINDIIDSLYPKGLISLKNKAFQKMILTNCENIFNKAQFLFLTKTTNNEKAINKYLLSSKERQIVTLLKYIPLISRSSLRELLIVERQDFIRMISLEILTATKENMQISITATGKDFIDKIYKFNKDYIYQHPLIQKQNYQTGTMLEFTAKFFLARFKIESFYKEHYSNYRVITPPEFIVSDYVFGFEDEYLYTFFKSNRFNYRFISHRKRKDVIINKLIESYQNGCLSKKYISSRPQLEKNRLIENNKNHFVRIIRNITKKEINKSTRSVKAMRELLLTLPIDQLWQVFKATFLAQPLI